MPRLLYLLCTALLVAWLCFAPLVWIVRDGLGPDAIGSAGWEAVRRFLMTFYWGPVALTLAAAAFFLRPRTGAAALDP